MDAKMGERESIRPEEKERMANYWEAEKEQASRQQAQKVKEKSCCKQMLSRTQMLRKITTLTKSQAHRKYSKISLWLGSYYKLSLPLLQRKNVQVQNPMPTKRTKE